jgi:magnesium chelatase subunit D
VIDTVTAAAARLACIAPEAVRAAARAFPNPHQGLRRELALRFAAVAEARLQGDDMAGAEHVAAAVKLFGLPASRPAVPPGAPASSPAPEPPPYGDTQRKREATGGMAPRLESAPSLVFVAAEVSIETGGAGEPPQVAAVEFAPEDRYPEDRLPPQREAGSLCFPIRRASAVRAGHGQVIGVERANQVRDLTVTATVIEAFKYSTIRRQALREGGETSPEGLLISPTDLRSYRRAVLPEKTLVLVVYYTAMEEEARIEALLPELQWAYTERASVCLTQVGAAGTDCEWRAQLLAASVLSPRLETALRASRYGR